MTREEAINMLKSKMDGHTDTSYEWVEDVRMAIETLEWIPVSEGLPEVGSEVLVCFDFKGKKRRVYFKLLW